MGEIDEGRDECKGGLEDVGVGVLQRNRANG